MKHILLIIIIALSSCAKKPAEKVYYEPEKEWVSIWSEEFNGPYLDTTLWTYEHGFVRNEEPQYYLTQNVELINGYLVITGKKETIENERFDPFSSDWRESREYAYYTSGSIKTIQALQCGKIVIRAKIPVFPGSWPALWTTGLVGLWPLNGEIDIAEYFGVKPGKIHSTVHYDDNGHVSKGGSTPFIDPDEFHIYSIEWNKDQIIFFLDEINYYTFDIGNQDEFKQPHQLRVNLALGAKWGGEIDDNSLPQKLEVDYIRWYQEKKKIPLSIIINLLLLGKK